MPRLGELLVLEGRITQSQLERAVQVRQLVGGRLGTHLLELGFVQEEVLLEALGRQRASGTAGAADLGNVKPAVIRAIPAKLALRYQVVPYLVRGKTLFIAAIDPVDMLREDEISFLTSFMVRTTMALELRVKLALHKYYGAPCEMRFPQLAKRLAEGSSGIRSVTLPPPPDVPPSVPPVPARPFPPSLPTPPLPTPPLPTQPLPTPPLLPAPPTPAGSEEKPQAQPAKPAAKSFIELDTEDLALLRRPASVEEKAPAPPAAELPVEPLLATQVEAQAPLLPAGPAELPAAAIAAAIAADSDDDDEDHDSLEARLAKASRDLQEAEIRDDIGDALLEFAGHFLSRRALLVLRKERIVGWRAEGPGVEESQITSLDLDSRLPSVFMGLREASSFWLGPLPGLPSNLALATALGGPGKDCLALPIVLRGKVVAYLYGDNGQQGVAGAPMAALRRLAGKAGLAFEVYILKSKIRLF